MPGKTPDNQPATWRTYLIPLLLSGLLILISPYYGYLLVHTLAEIFSVMIAVVMAVVVWNTRIFTRNDFLLYLGGGLFWIAMLDLTHILVYKGMPFPGANEPNTSLQIWVYARLLQSVLMISAPLFFTRRLNPYLFFYIAGAIAFTAILSAMHLSQPVMFIEGQGLTAFKIQAEYASMTIMAAAIIVYVRMKAHLPPQTFVFLVLSMLLAILSEFAFTLYADIYGPVNMAGHILKIFSFWMIYKAVAQTTLQQPFSVMAQGANTYNAIPHPAVVVNNDGLIGQVNRQAERFAGLPAKDLLQSHVHQHFHPQDREPQDCEICEHIRSGRDMPQKTFYLPQKKVWHLISLSPVLVNDRASGTVQSSTDISENIRVRREIRHKEKIFRSILNNMPVIYYSIDAGSQLDELSGSAVHLLTDDAGQLVGRNIGELFPKLTGLLDEIRAIGQYFTETRHERETNELWFLHYLFSDPADHGKLIGFALDISKLKRSEQELLKLGAEKRNLARRMLQAQEEVRHEVAHDLHDEIGQALTAIRAIAATMVSRQDATADYYTELADNIIDIAASMYDSAYTLMYRLRPAALDSMDMAQALRSCIKSSGLEKAGVDIDFQVDGDLDSLSELVKITAYRILQESLTNVAKHADATHVMIHFSRRRQMLPDRRYEDRTTMATPHPADEYMRDVLQIRVLDNGMGYSDKDADNISPSSLRERVQALGGTISVETGPDSGTGILVLIDLDAVEAETTTS